MSIYAGITHLTLGRCIQKLQVAHMMLAPGHCIARYVCKIPLFVLFCHRNSLLSDKTRLFSGVTYRAQKLESTTGAGSACLVVVHRLCMI